MASIEPQNQGQVKKSRRSHQKSRNGCFECKRRRVKCDETKPSCNKCILGLYKCIYPQVMQPAGEKRRDELSIPNFNSDLHSPSPSSSSYSEGSNKVRRSSSPTTSSPIDMNQYSESPSSEDTISDTDLYHHYLQHTSHTLTHVPKHQRALQIGMPALALQSETVYHSLLAISAACLGMDLINKEPAPTVSKIRQISLIGYKHYNLASEKMRNLISGTDSSKLEILLASAIVLVPFAIASQQLNHWISSNSESYDSHKILSTTPRDVIVLMRGIRTTIETLELNSWNSGTYNPAETVPPIQYYDDTDAKPPGLAPSRNHIMFPIVAKTSQKAFQKLQNHLDTALVYQGDGLNGQLSACDAAFKILKQIRDQTFDSPYSPSLHSIDDQKEVLPEPRATYLPHMAPWLRNFASSSPSPSPTEPLVRFFLAFLVQVPQSYLDIVLPLLDQRLEIPINSVLDDPSAELTMEQVLALDIYAHWSVLMFLLEEESWYLGKLPAVTLAGMVNRYSEKFVSKFWPENAFGQDSWWPGSMLNILREIKYYQ